MHKGEGVKPSRGAATGVTPAQFREAERGLGPTLARTFSATWIAENAKDVLSQANAGYAEWLKDNPPARNPVGWLLNCVYWRAIHLLDRETRKPRSMSLDAVHHLPDSTATPEQQVLESDLRRQLRKALNHLPQKERKLLILVYVAHLSIREAGRKLGWQKSAADRHHKAAMEKMRALISGDQWLWTP